MSAIIKESLVRSSTQLVAKATHPRDDSTLAQLEEDKIHATKNAAHGLHPSFSSASLPSSSSSRVEWKPLLPPSLLNFSS